MTPISVLFAALAHAPGIGDRVTFTGCRADIPDNLTILDVVMHASIQPEPFGRVAWPR
jgi:hypothetical protein